jgi:hypothetical protein
MSNQNKSFHPRLIITDHFDLIINKIDIKIETLLLDQSLTKERINELNKSRQEQIYIVKEIEKINLDQQEFNLNDYDQKWSILISDPLLEFEQKIDKIKQEIISIDCVLLEQSTTVNGLNLWITSEFQNKKDLEFLT